MHQTNQNYTDYTIYTYTMNNTDLNNTGLKKVYAFDKIAKLLSDNKFEAVTNKEEVRGLHRDSKTGQVSAYTYATFLGKTKYKLNLTNDEVRELLSYVLEGMDMVIVPKSMNRTIDQKRKDKEGKKDGSGDCSDCNEHNVDGPSCDLGDISVPLSWGNLGNHDGSYKTVASNQGRLTVGYQKLYNSFASGIKQEVKRDTKDIERDIKNGIDVNNDDDDWVIGVKLFAVDSNGVYYNDYFSFFSNCELKDDKVYYKFDDYYKNLKKLGKELGVEGEDVTQIDGSKIELVKLCQNKNGKYHLKYDWDAIIAAYKVAFYDCFGYRRKDKDGVSCDVVSCDGLGNVNSIASGINDVPKSVYKEYSRWHTVDW